MYVERLRVMQYGGASLSQDVGDRIGRAAIL